MEKQHPIGDLMTTTMQKLREIADVNTIVGKPILAGEITIIPISKLTVGLPTIVLTSAISRSLSKVVVIRSQMGCCFSIR